MHAPTRSLQRLEHSDPTVFVSGLRTSTGTTILLGGMTAVVLFVALLAVVALLLWRRHKQRQQSISAPGVGLKDVLLPKDGMGGNSDPRDDSIWQHDLAEEAPTPGLAFQEEVGLGVGTSQNVF